MLTVKLNESLSFDVYLSDETGYFDSDVHDNKHIMHITTLDGENLGRTGADEPTYFNSEVEYLSYEYPVFGTIFSFNFPEQVKIGIIETEDTIGNKDTFIEGVDYTSPIFDIQYPDHWYEEVENTSTNTSSTVIQPQTIRTEKSSIPVRTGSILVGLCVISVVMRKVIAIRLEF